MTRAGWASCTPSRCTWSPSIVTFSPASSRVVAIDDLAQRRHPRRRRRADLFDPEVDAVTEAHVEAAGEHLGQRGDLHGCVGHVANHGRSDADADADLRRRRERRGGLREPAVEAEVFDDPQLVEAALFDARA